MEPITPLGEAIPVPPTSPPRRGKARVSSRSRTRRLRHRRKLSTTVAPETQEYLQRLMLAGHAASMAEAVDRAVSVARHFENRAKLEEATAAYYASLSPEALREEQQLENAVAHTASTVDFDAE